jgi:hypothetical protein
MKTGSRGEVGEGSNPRVEWMDADPSRGPNNTLLPVDQ